MADEIKISGLNPLGDSEIEAIDEMVIVDKSDTTQALTGSTKRINAGAFAKAAGALQSLPGTPNSIVYVWSGTQAQYDALGLYQSNTLYFIEGEPE